MLGVALYVEGCGHLNAEVDLDRDCFVRLDFEKESNLAFSDSIVASCFGTGLDVDDSGTRSKATVT